MEHTFFRLKCDNNIFTDRQICDDTIFLSVFRKICHTKLHCIDRSMNLHFFSVNFQFTGIRFISSINCTDKFRTSGSKKSCKSDNLTFVDRHIKRFDRSFMAKSFCLDNRDEFFEFCMISLDICKIIKVFTHHLGNKHNSWQIFDFVFANQFPIS